MTELHETTLCIDTGEGFMECPATFQIDEETGDARLRSFRIHAFIGTRIDATRMTGPEHVRQQERLAWQAWQDGEGDRVRSAKQEAAA